LYFLAAPTPNTSRVEKPLVGISNAKDIPCTTLTHMRTPVNAPGPLV
jgi:hypothetical protein